MTKRGRSREWQALAYPSNAQKSMLYKLVALGHNKEKQSCLSDRAVTNRILVRGGVVSEKQQQQQINLFPLQHHVVIACLRSMLILDGQIDGRTFQLKHIGLQRRMQDDDSDSSNGHNQQNDDAVDVEHHRYDKNSAEDLTQDVLRRAMERYFEASAHCFCRSQPCEAEDQEDTTEDDADILTSSNTINGSNSSSSSSFADQDDCFCEASTEEDAFGCASNASTGMIHLSIDAEEYFRRKAQYFTHFLLSSFSDFVLRLFCNRGVCTPREKLESSIATLLFDVSHAMFAWQQTEKEILENAAITKSDICSRNEIDAKVFDTLLGDDERALKRIGGFQSNSLLPSALSIARLKARNMSWSRFATTLGGGLSISPRVNFDRRMRAKRRRYSGGDDSTFSRAQPRSRSNSTISSASGGSTRSRSNSSAAITDTDMSIASSGADNYLRLSIARTASNKWGVTLVREGKTCVVHNISDDVVVDAEVDNSEEEQGHESPSKLQTGDVIVSFVDEQGKLFSTASANYDDEDSLWFDAAVDAFKRSQSLCVTVKRVQAASDF
eukprot:CAMPEP_0116017074 /NCGR_PEP_ID=MMETSP0321-20121206/7841_1 /TAXON_ID=163516 /ORGANISM="Leptocylindrus danicus var. danicus, Strain B650" /LENGTH=553 /DNA_ID=CAMNT_0003487217 /DNA_START=185 /DNA_END=1846 /DNA_ORIENTATION=+